MKINYFGVLLLVGALSSCSNAEQKENITKTTNTMSIQFTDDHGNKISKSELANATGNFNYEIYGIENVSELAKSLHAQARQFGQSGDYANAISKLEQAHKEAPNWPYPLYDLAFTYLLQDDYENALKYYQLTDNVAPKGFYTSKTALYTLEKEKSGEFQKGLYKTYLSLEWMESQAEKNQMIQLLVEKIPNFAPAWKDYSNLLENDERLAAINKGLEQHPDAETKGMLLINKALVTNESGDSTIATGILTNLIFNPNATNGNIELAKFVLNSISE